MADEITLPSDFVIYEQQIQSGRFEAFARNLNAFNAASNNCIRLVPMEHRGQYLQSAFFDDISNLIERRDPTSDGAADDKKMTQDEEISVKLHRRIGPVLLVRDSWRKIGATMQEINFMVGEMIGRHEQRELLDRSLAATVAALSNQASISHTASGQLTHSVLLEGLRLYGDMADRIVCWVMHSSPYFDLVGNVVEATNPVDPLLESIVVRNGSPGTYNRPVIITDSLSTTSGSGSAQTFDILGLTENGVRVLEQGARDMVADTVTGKDNLSDRIQGEFDFSLGIKGFKWDTGNGGANPDNATLATGSNWDKVFDDDKNLAGIHISVTT